MEEFLKHFCSKCYYQIKSIPVDLLGNKDFYEQVAGNDHLNTEQLLRACHLNAIFSFA